MASVSESPKTPPTQQHYPANYAQFPNAFPPGAFPPPFYTYAPPPPEGGGENSGHHAPYMMPYPPPPGMVYAYQPPSQAFYQGDNGKQSKRRQVKMACTNCAAACKRCDEARPCERCIKYGLGDQCLDGTRKERKKGIKRGPYKRKNKTGGGSNASSGSSEPAPAFGSFVPHPSGAHPNGEGSAVVEWHVHAPPPPPQPSASPDAAASSSAPGESSSAAASAAASTSAAAAHPMPQYGPPPGAEGYYPYYYPPMPPGFMPHPQAPGQEGSDGTVQPGAMVQFYPMPPGAYPFPPHFPYPPPHPSQHPHQLQHPQQQNQPQQTIDPKNAQIAQRQESEEEAEEEEESSPVIRPSSNPDPPSQITLVPVSAADAKTSSASSPAKKRTRGARNGTTGEPKVKKARTGKKSKRTSET
ncbi:hypothetical protein FIBSPDRAFT_1047199 [Athelia psychrophila]|uniref:Transcription activator of gluconeogenesis ERT1 n=1 Tax=Athelia psychrophila TaxID=1759441 RepID=A0A166FL25_9AGAM|nr:hypothetical protein FIBSPDRAFT_1047199 [Fibularhizoctonia sp. CBS 109695]